MSRHVHKHPALPDERASLITFGVLLVLTLRTQNPDLLSLRDACLRLDYRAPGICDLLGADRTGNRDRRKVKDAIMLYAIAEAMGVGRRTSYSRRREFYSRDPDRFRSMTYCNVVGGVDELTANGLLDNRIAEGKGPSGTQSTFILAPHVGASEIALAVEPFLTSRIVMRDADKRPMDFRESARSRQMANEVSAINEAITSVSLSIGASHLKQLGYILKAPDYAVRLYQVHLRRIFNETFGQGGRFYGGWWQLIPAVDRATILIDGQPVVELDHKNLHPRMLYEDAGLVLDFDAYDLAGVPRKLAKVAFNILINADSRASTIGAVIDAIWKFYGRPAKAGEVAKIIEVIEDRHPQIKTAFHSGSGRRLQRRDSDMLAYVLRKLQKTGIVALPIHDSFIVQRQHEGRLKEVMDAVWTDKYS